MAGSSRIISYPVTGASGAVFPSSAATPNERAEWGYYGFTLANRSNTESFQVAFTDENGALMDVLDLDPGETRSDWYGPYGIVFAQRLSVTFVPDTASGKVTGAVRVG